MLTGGPGNEAPISRQSCRTFGKALKAFDFLRVSIWDGRQQGVWQEVDEQGEPLGPMRDFYHVLQKIKEASSPLVVPLIHGRLGEDGKLASIFESLEIPYLFSSSSVCALTLHKFAACRFLAHFGIKVPASSLVFHWQSNLALSIIRKYLEKYGTVVLKPVDEGSSIHMTVVSSLDDRVKDFLEGYWREHQVLMVEQYVDGDEYTVGVYENPSDGVQRILPPVRIVPLEASYFDYNAKYVPGKAEETFQLSLSSLKEEELCAIAERISRLFQVKGLTRSDFMFDRNSQEFYFLEINTIPGLTDNSLVPKSIRQAGYQLDPFLARILATAFARKNEREDFLSCFK